MDGIKLDRAVLEKHFYVKEATAKTGKKNKRMREIVILILFLQRRRRMTRKS